jgi:hypothetical protein
MTEHAPAYELHFSRAWLPLPCGGRALRHDASYEPVVGRTYEPAKRKQRKVRAVESVADVERRDRANGGARLTAEESKRHGEASNFKYGRAVA